jgi:hypothetical protein
MGMQEPLRTVDVDVAPESKAEDDDQIREEARGRDWEARRRA